MPITISGSTGIAGVDGSASTPAIQGTDTNSGITFPAADTVAVSTGGTERMRIDSSGNVGIGTTSINKKFVVSNAGAAGIELDPFGRSQETASSILSYNRSTSAYIPLHFDASVQKFYISGTERARIDSSGNFLVGTTTSGGNGFIAAPEANGANITLRTATTSSQILEYFINPNGLVGYIQTSGSSTSYVTSSDYRLKENVQPMQDALAKVALLNPVTYKWKVDGSNGEGFIAHELQAVCPDAVTGEKDAVDKDGNPLYQGVDTSFLVATLTAAIQEQQSIIEDLKARVTALEAK